MQCRFREIVSFSIVASFSPHSTKGKTREEILKLTAVLNEKAPADFCLFRESCILDASAYLACASSSCGLIAMQSTIVSRLLDSISTNDLANFTLCATCIAYLRTWGTRVSVDESQGVCDFLEIPLVMQTYCSRKVMHEDHLTNTVPQLLFN
ncbi:hypothetical protein ASPFODRAFT_452603 [Aspergillus luchuensis CBS 106.47]|uniref:Uncharacterized protein n=1 Tax=Aspergillus luchuensis (strain CBS 106.47) TaxID=1137211 RepID=A0A1M3TXE8_ASPLC|nr:hypothetical protein ASPFODRAFT_452603 [Aspergillus luchuensis CBS 106.47]